MPVPVTKLHILRLMLQADQNLTQLQRDIRGNAAAWKARAQAQDISVVTLALWMDDAAAAYSTRLGWISTLQTDTTNWNSLVTMWQLLGGTSGEFSSVITPMQNVADQIPLADKSTYAAIIAGCDQILTAINAPLSLWPE